MTKKSRPGQLYELREARKRIGESANVLERLLKDHKALDQRSIESHKERFIEDINEASEFLEKSFNEILKDLEKHKKRISSMHRFVKRHYRLK